MAIILKTTETATGNDNILGEEWYGEFNLLCSVYASDDVSLQVREKGGTWKDASFNGDLIVLSRAGDTALVTLAADYDYRVVTDNAGAEVRIARQDRRR